MERIYLTLKVIGYLTSFYCNRMEACEANPVSRVKVEIRQIFAHFLVEVRKLEDIIAIGRRFLVGFQQQLELLRRPPITETSELVKGIIKAVETRRFKSYVEAGWMNPGDNVSHINDMNMCFDGLQDHLSKAKEIMFELESLMDSAGDCLYAEIESASDDPNEIKENADSDMKGGESSSVDGEFDSKDCAALMAVIYGMVKQDYVMQERIVCSLNLKTCSEELSSYCLMWSLRPFVDDDVISEAFRLL